MKDWRAVLPIFLLWAAGLCDSPLRADNGTLTGIVADAQGRPIAGALVKVTSTDLGLGFVVVSQAQGRYRTPCLPPGNYTVQAFGAGFQSAAAKRIEVRDNAVANLALIDPLHIPERKRMTDLDYAKRMPEGSGKNAVATRCATCHSLQWVAAARKTPQQWRQTVDRMRDYFQGRIRPLNNISGEADVLQLDIMADYLAKNFTHEHAVDPQIIDRSGGPAHPYRNLPGANLKQDYIAMEFTLPPDSNPSGIAADAHGVAWISEANSGKLGRFDPASMKYSRISAPGINPQAHATSLAVDPSGHVWLAVDGPDPRLLRYDPGIKEFTSYQMPAYPFAVPSPNRIVALRFVEGNVWATGMTSDRVIRLDPATRKTTEFPVPKGSSPFGLALGGDRRLWYTAEVGNTMGRLDPVTGLLAYYNAPAAKSELHGLAADADGNLWAGSTETGQLIRLDFRTGAIAEFAPPSEDSGPYSVDVDTSRNLVWFSQLYADRIARFDPRTASTIEFPLPSADSDVRRIEVDRSRPNRVWWAGGLANKIGYVEVQ
jgi:streptogramin lyase